MAALIALQLTSFITQPASLAIRCQLTHTSAGSVTCLAPAALDRREALAALAALPALALSPELAGAESTLVTRQAAYSRYVPRIERGRDYWSTGLKKAIGAGDWASIKGATEAKGSIDRIFGPMELWASSWSGKSISDKTLEMNKAINELRECAADLQLAADGQEASGGLFGFIGGPKKIDDVKRKQIAQAAYTKGVDAINKFIELGNDGLGLQFSPLDTID